MRGGPLPGHVEADDLTAAKAFTDVPPFLSNGDGKFAVEIFGPLPMQLSCARIGDFVDRVAALRQDLDSVGIQKAQ